MTEGCAGVTAQLRLLHGPVWQAQSHRAELYRSTHPDLLAWDRRWSMIQQEVHHLHPDIVCFQVRVWHVCGVCVGG